MKRSAFTMVELVFVIVVLGILASIAIPKLAASRDDAHVTRAISTVAAVRSAIVNERQLRLFRGRTNYITRLDRGVAGNVGDPLFDSNVSTATDPENILLAYPVISDNQSGGWMKTGANTYTFTLTGVAVAFTYTPATGRFDCNRDAADADEKELCRTLVD